MTIKSSGTLSITEIQAEFGGPTPIQLSNYYKGGAYVSGGAAAPNVPTSGVIQLSNFYGASKGVVGQIEYTVNGTYNFVVPAGVTSISFVIVAAGHFHGGHLRYKNNVAVTPGQTFEVVIGEQYCQLVINGVIYIVYSSLNSYQTMTSTNFDGGGDGGINGRTYDLYTGYGGNTTGGGAGGYTGSGGEGTSIDYNNAIHKYGTSGSGGGGAGGGPIGTELARMITGGGVGLKGQGANGVYPCQGGSGGSSGGYYSPGGSYGGGGGFGAVNSGQGAIRIIWGSNRSYPSTNTGDL